MALKNFLLAGFGGQGILFSGKVIAYSGLMDGKEVSWLPSYGPEMRGGTANCSVCISDDPIGSPLVLSPDVLMAMNLQSFDKFINAVVSGGTAVIDSTLVDKKTERTDITSIYVPATALASIVLPVPGGPTKRIPFGMEAPISLYLSGSCRYSTISVRFSFASSSPATSVNLIPLEDFT